MFAELTIKEEIEFGMEEIQFPGFGGSPLGLQPEEITDSKYLELNQRDTRLVGRREASICIYCLNSLKNQNQDSKWKKTVFFQRKYFSLKLKSKNSQKNYNPKSSTRKSTQI